VVEAGVDRGALPADLFGCGDPVVAVAVPFGDGMEEQRAVRASACGIELPFPICDKRGG